jgi:hypothetical protein
MKIISLSNVFPIRVELGDEDVPIQMILFVDVFTKKVYNERGREMIDIDICNEVLNRMGQPKSVVIPQEVEFAKIDKQMKQRGENYARSI